MTACWLPTVSSDDEVPAASRRTNKAATSASASSRRKSGNVAQSASGTPGASSSVGGDSKTDVSKAIKRKEQNRAAQKAFRERREQRVKDVSLLCRRV
jgi:AP-1-like factor